MLSLDFLRDRKWSGCLIDCGLLLISVSHFWFSVFIIRQRKLEHPLLFEQHACTFHLIYHYKCHFLSENDWNWHVGHTSYIKWIHTWTKVPNKDYEMKWHFSVVVTSNNDVLSPFPHKKTQKAHFVWKYNKKTSETLRP